jgi:2-dehydropantoate 2-reductase
MAGPVVHILGPGRIGSLIATSLASTVPPAQVSLIFRSREKLLKYQQNGSTISMWSDGIEPTMALERKIPGVCIGPKESSSDYIEDLIVTTKAQQALSAIKPVLRNLDRNSNVLLLQNGVGVLENLVEKYWSRESIRPNLMIGATSHAVRTFSGPWRFNHVGSGYLKLAQVPRDMDQKLRLANTVHFEKTDSEACVRADQVAENLDLSATAVLPNYKMSPLPTDSEASVKADYATDIKIFPEPLPALFKALLRTGPILNAEVLPYPEFLLAQYEKLIVNACINPVAALLQCTNGALLHTDHVESIFKLCLISKITFTLPIVHQLSELLWRVTGCCALSSKYVTKRQIIEIQC